jgi:hypothetical protein
MEGQVEPTCQDPALKLGRQKAYRVIRTVRVRIAIGARVRVTQPEAGYMQALCLVQPSDIAAHGAGRDGTI